MNKTITLTEREIQALWLAIDSAKNCYDWDYEFSREEREDLKAWERVLVKMGYKN